jgi:chemotaxis protein MotB
LAGHTETHLQPGREAGSKWELSTERANAARRKVVQSGVDDDQICKVSGYADTAPMPDFPPEAEINRRVTVMLKLNESIESLSRVTTAKISENDTHPN